MSLISMAMNYPSASLVRHYTRAQIRAEIMNANARHNLKLTPEEIEDAMKRWKDSYGFKDDEPDTDFGPVCP